MMAGRRRWAWVPGDPKCQDKELEVVSWVVGSKGSIWRAWDSSGSSTEAGLGGGGPQGVYLYAPGGSSPGSSVPTCTGSPLALGGLMGLPLQGLGT